MNIIQQLKSFEISSDSKLYKQETLQISAWKSPPTLAHVDPDLSVVEILELIGTDGPLQLNADPEKLPMLRTHQSVIVFPKRFEVRAEPKPYLLVITLAIINHCFRENPASEKSHIVDALCAYDIIIPRNCLKKIMSTSKVNDGIFTWEVYAMRPATGWPVYVYRVRSYMINPKSIGMIFQKATSSETEYYRTYCTGRGVFSTGINGKVIVGFTGETDAFDSKNNPVEITTRPGWIKSPLKNRVLDSWIQSRISGVKTIVIGLFKQQPNDYCAPAVFKENRILHENLISFGRSVIGKEEALEYGAKVMQEITEFCTETGVVYRVSGCRDTKTTFEKLDPDTKFPITYGALENCIDAMCSQNKDSC